MFDITTLAVSETSTLQLRDANGNPITTPSTDGGEPKPVTVTVYGPGSKEHARAVAKRSSRNMTRLRRKGSIELSADDVAAEGAEFLAAITVRFDNLAYKGLSGHELAMAVYADRRLGFIADQVNEYISEWDHFSVRSETASA